MRLECLNCRAPLDVDLERCLCLQCGAQWPISGGIPRFFQTQSYYWGEVKRNEAQQLLDAARKGSWVKAVQAHFAEEETTLSGILDLRRASWAALLGLSQDSKVLDVGSGYGAITHSLSRSAGEVYSIEAVSERIEFTHERLRQEGITNVRLIQTSATQLPFPDNSFDLVVANGVLEWVGEWDLAGDPRSAQMRFLGSMNRLLKEDGVLVVGIENRLGYNYFLGGKDHSGIPYTSLVPRDVASFLLRHTTLPHHRTSLNPKKEYRTFTWSERGYRKLLADAGFSDVTSYWADPGYNQPYHLIPLSSTKWIREHFLNLVNHPGPAPRQSWRRRLKRAISSSRFVALTVPEFVFLASKKPIPSMRVQSWVGRLLAQNSGEQAGDGFQETQATVLSLHTGSHTKTSVLRIAEAMSDRDRAYVKVSIEDPKNSSEDNESINREKVRKILQYSKNQTANVPRTYGTLRIGNTRYKMESAAAGEQFCQTLRGLDYFSDERRVANDFGGLFDNLIRLTEVLQNVDSPRPVNPSWYEIPEEFELFPRLRDVIEEKRYFGASFTNSRPTWVQHGDLSVENLSIDVPTGQITVFDWDDLAIGFPPLYDLFEILYSTGYLAPEDDTTRFASEEERWIASFKAVFLSNESFADIAAENIFRACERLGVAPDLVPTLLIEFLLMRANYYARKSPVQRRIHLHLLKFCIEQDCFAEIVRSRRFKR